MQGHSVFDIEDVRKVVQMGKLAEAKAYALDKIANSTANSKNKTQISEIVKKSTSVNSLATAMTNHILAHPSEGLKVI